MSTAMVRCTSGSKAMSPLMASQFPSKASPRSRPSASSTGLPELPPVMSLLVRKQVGTRPSTAYGPKSWAR